MATTFLAICNNELFGNINKTIVIKTRMAKIYARSSSDLSCTDMDTGTNTTRRGYDN